MLASYANILPANVRSIFVARRIAGGKAKLGQADYRADGDIVGIVYAVVLDDIAGETFTSVDTESNGTQRFAPAYGVRLACARDDV